MIVYHFYDRTVSITMVTKITFSRFPPSVALNWTTSTFWGVLLLTKRRSVQQSAWLQSRDLMLSLRRSHTQVNISRCSAHRQFPISGLGHLKQASTAQPSSTWLGFRQPMQPQTPSSKGVASSWWNSPMLAALAVQARAMTSADSSTPKQPAIQHPKHSAGCTNPKIANPGPEPTSSSNQAPTLWV